MFIFGCGEIGELIEGAVGLLWYVARLVLVAGPVSRCRSLTIRCRWRGRAPGPTRPSLALTATRRRRSPEAPVSMSTLASWAISRSVDTGTVTQKTTLCVSVCQ
jgi:hypothetical protein